jgi:hypothetical protein
LVNVIGETKLGLNNRLPLLALVYTLSENVRVLVKEEE